MARISNTLKSRLVGIIRDEYEECQFFTASAQMLVNKIKDISEAAEQGDVEFNTLRDSIGDIGLYLDNTEKRLQEIDECYTKLVEALSDEKDRN